MTAKDEPARRRYENLVDRLEGLLQASDHRNDGPDLAGGSLSQVDLSHPDALLAETDWGSLEHAYGTAEDTPAHLVGLLDTDQRVRSQALDHLHYAMHHQNTLYTATIPAALYVAGILPDPRTARPVDKERHDLPGPLRAALLGWLDSVADAADDETGAAMRRFGFPPEEYPPFVGICEIRPVLFSAVSACFDDRDPDVRGAAIAACIPMLDDPRLHRHRKALVPLLRETLTVSTKWQYQERAIEALAAWGEDTSGLEVRREAFEVCHEPNDTSSAADWVLSPSDAADLPF
ncbi:hypothetical protein ACFVWZ_08920 [Streptomyces sp. NPDC058200]|uniref:hypothetical protein n=1 Tax=Streptomyces sp. NPDC058200 TaxID=3346378 RepID=UPI0036E1E105